MMGKISDELREFADAEVLSAIQISMLKRMANRIDDEMVELPKDREGKPIHPGDIEYRTNGDICEIYTIEIDGGGAYVTAMVGGGTDHADVVDLDPCKLTHTMPDSLEHIVDNKERQEVAERLKSLIPDVNGMRDLAAYLDFWIGVEGSDVDYLYRVRTDRKAAKMTLEKLADLIDPVCHMANTSSCNGLGMWGCVCSACGAYIEYSRAKSINYCPHCGARVVND